MFIYIFNMSYYMSDFEQYHQIDMGTYRGLKIASEINPSETLT